MSSLTIHGLDPDVEKRIRGKARKERKSLNQTVKELLAKSVGMRASSPADDRADFVEFAGIWSERDLREFEAATADLERIDEEDWR